MGNHRRTSSRPPVLVWIALVGALALARQTIAPAAIAAQGATPTLTPAVAPTASPTATATAARPLPTATLTPTAVPATATPTAIATQTASPAPTASATALPTATPSPTASSTPTATPSPTITIVAVELPPTATPNLNSEQERIGTITVLIFCALVVILIVFSVRWVARGRHST